MKFLRKINGIFVLSAVSVAVLTATDAMASTRYQAHSIGNYTYASESTSNCSIRSWNVRGAAGFAKVSVNTLRSTTDFFARVYGQKLYYPNNNTEWHGTSWTSGWVTKSSFTQTPTYFMPIANAQGSTVTTGNEDKIRAVTYVWIKKNGVESFIGTNNGEYCNVSNGLG